MNIDPAMASLSPPATLSIELREGLPFFEDDNQQDERPVVRVRGRPRKVDN